MSILEASPQIGDRIEPTRGYTREKDAGDQLLPFNNIAPSAVAGMLFGRTAALNQARICEEVLVTLLRRCYESGEDDGAWRIADEITRRIKGRIARTLTLWRLDQPNSIAEEVIEEIITAVYDALFDLSPREEFWEIRFWVALDRKMLKIVQAKRTEIDSIRDTDLETNLDSEDETLLCGTKHPAFESLTNPITGTLVGEALSLLSANERAAFLLKHMAGMPESSAKVDGPLTIAAVLKVSPRTVRNYLARAEKTLARWRDPLQLPEAMATG